MLSNELSNWQALALWWAFFWRSTLSLIPVGLLFGGAVALAVPLTASVGRPPLELILVLVPAAILLLTVLLVAIQVWAIGKAFSLPYGASRVVVVDDLSVALGQPSGPLPVSGNLSALALWWAYAWRSFLLGLLVGLGLGLAVGIPLDLLDVSDKVADPLSTIAGLLATPLVGVLTLKWLFTATWGDRRLAVVHPHVL